jgi:hypothetical protein
MPTGPEEVMSSRLIALTLLVIFLPAASAQDDSRLLRLEGLLPGGGRDTVTEAWSTLGFSIENRGETYREARVIVYYPDRRDLQFGRDVWIPARSRITSWLPIGPAPDLPSELRRDFHYRLLDRTGGALRPLSSTDPAKIPSRAVPYRKREPTTAILMDAVEGGTDPLASSSSQASEAVLLARTFRHARGLSERVSVILDRELPPTPEALDGIDHLILTGNSLAADSAGRQAIRYWVLQGGVLWVMLDRVEPDVIAPILGDGQRFEIVDRTSLTTVRLRAMMDQPAEVAPREFDYPVDLVRVLLSGNETPLFEVNGWPAAFSRPMGRGQVIITTLGSRGWYRDRVPRDPPSRFENFSDLPVSLAALDSLAWQIHPETQSIAFRSEDLGPLLTAEIGYEVLGRKSAAVILIGFVLTLLALGLWLRRSRTPELIGLIGPAVAVVAASLFVIFGLASRQAVPSTAASAAVVEFSPESGEATSRGVFAIYRPESGIVHLGSEHGGDVELDQSGLEGQSRTRIQTDLDAWHWEDLAFPSGVRQGPFRSTIRARATATGRFGTDGLEGRLSVGTFRDPADAVILTRSGTVLTPRLDSSGSYTVGRASAIPGDQYLAGPVLTDRQQRRQDVYRKLLARPRPPHLEGRDYLLVWTESADVPFTSGDSNRQFSTALLIIPLEIERPSGDSPVTIPTGFCSFTAVTEGRSHRPTLEGTTPVRNRLRFQLPPSVLPFQVEKATLVARVRATGRRFTVSGIAEGQSITLENALNPLGLVQVEITDPRALQIDPAGGLVVEVTVSGLIGPDGREIPSRLSDPDVKWQIEDLGLEVNGRHSDQ